MFIFCTMAKNYLVLSKKYKTFLLDIFASLIQSLIIKNLIQILKTFIKMHTRGITGGWAGWAIAHPGFDRIESRWEVAAHHITTCPPSFRAT